MPYRCGYAIEVDDEARVEKLVYQAFADHRTLTTRDFFEIDPQRVIAALKLTLGRDVTPKSDIAKDIEGVKVLEKATRKTRKTYKFSDAGLSEGDTIYYANDDTVMAQVINEKKILFEGYEISLSRSALMLLQREGYTWQTVTGWQYWMFEGETIAERLKRLLDDADEPELDEND